jgi:hypothetical protein
MTVYANLVEGEIKGVYDLLPKTWNGHENFNLKCAADPVFMKENDFVKIVRDTTPFDATTHKMSDFPTYTVENGEVIEHRDILEIPPAPPETEQESTTLTATTLTVEEQQQLLALIKKLSNSTL